MRIKWVKVCDSDGVIHDFGDDLEGFSLEVIEGNDGSLIVKHNKKTDYTNTTKHRCVFRKVSWYQIMTYS